MRRILSLRIFEICHVVVVVVVVVVFFGPQPYPVISCASLKKSLESCPFAAPCGPRRKKNDRGQRSAFPSETSRFALSIVAHRGSARPWAVNDRAALHVSPVLVNDF